MLSASHLRKKTHCKYSFSHPSLSPSRSELIRGSGSGTAAGLPSPLSSLSNTIGMIAGPAVRNHCRTQNNGRKDQAGGKEKNKPTESPSLLSLRLDIVVSSLPPSLNHHVSPGQHDSSLRIFKMYTRWGLSSPGTRQWIFHT